MQVASDAGALEGRPREQAPAYRLRVDTGDGPRDLLLTTRDDGAAVYRLVHLAPWGRAVAATADVITAMAYRHDELVDAPGGRAAAGRLAPAVHDALEAVLQRLDAGTRPGASPPPPGVSPWAASAAELLELAEAVHHRLCEVSSAAHPGERDQVRARVQACADDLVACAPGWAPAAPLLLS